MSRDPRRDALRGFEPRETSAERPDDNQPPIHWPTLGAIPAAREWTVLGTWVDEMRSRYPGLDSYVVPACWYTHESLVSALQALKDHERVAYAATSPGSAAVDWHRALRDLSALLRQFTADLRCDHGTEFAERETFEEFVKGDISRRRRRAATVALGDPEDPSTE
jgi:hypothetical protein